MPKKQLFYIAAILLITAIIWFLTSNKKSTISTDNTFDVSDTSSVTKVFIADRNGTTLTLVRTDGNWTVNDKYNVRKDAINTLLYTIKSIRVERPVPTKIFDKVIRNLATSGVKVEVYTNKETPFKTYTVGGSANNHLGSYMLQEGAEAPFVVHIPSVNGFLGPRYGIQGSKLDIYSWRDNTVFSLSSNEIRNISVKHLNDIEKSFSWSANPRELANYKGELVSENPERLLQLVNSFKKLNCEIYKEEKHKIEFATPLHELVVNSDTLRTYSIGESVSKEKKKEFNVKRMYATLNNGELMLIQDYVFNKVLITIDELVN